MSNMRQKRKLRAVEAEQAEIAKDHEIPELQEAIQAAEIAAKLEEIEQERSKMMGSPLDKLGPVPIKNVIESLLFAADKPLSVLRMKQLMRRRKDDDIRAALDELKKEYENRGILLHKVAGGYQFRTHPTTARWVQQLIAGRPVRLSRAQLETLAIIAYRQPVTRPEVDEIRGVDSGGTLRILLERSLIRVLGKKEEPGRPLLYGTTKDFLEFFNLQDLGELPTLQEYHVLNEDSLHEARRLGVDLSADEGVILSVVPDPEPEVQAGAGDTAEAAVGEAETAELADESAGEDAAAEATDDEGETAELADEPTDDAADESTDEGDDDDGDTAELADESVDDAEDEGDDDAGDTAELADELTDDAADVGDDDAGDTAELVDEPSGDAEGDDVGETAELTDDTSLGDEQQSPVAEAAPAETDPDTETAS